MALLSSESLQKIEREAAKYPPEQRQSAVMSALAIAQDQHGWLSNEVMEEVAKVLRMPPEGKLDASGSPLISSLPLNSVTAVPLSLSVKNESCFSAVMPVSG